MSQSSQKIVDFREVANTNGQNARRHIGNGKDTLCPDSDHRATIVTEICFHFAALTDKNLLFKIFVGDASNENASGFAATCVQVELCSYGSCTSTGSHGLIADKQFSLEGAISNLTVVV